jgi:hypothetical protein
MHMSTPQSFRKPLATSPCDSRERRLFALQWRPARERVHTQIVWLWCAWPHHMPVPMLHVALCLGVLEADPCSRAPHGMAGRRPSGGRLGSVP